MVWMRISIFENIYYFLIHSNFKIVNCLRMEWKLMIDPYVFLDVLIVDTLHESVKHFLNIC